MTPSTQVRQVRSVPARESLVTASLPLLRASAFAAIAVPASLVGHLAGGGGIPDEATLLLAVALVIVVYRVALAARERSWPVITLALAGAEFAVHVLFDTGGANTGWPGPTAIAPGTPAMNMSAMIAGHADAGSGLLMMAGHAGAVVLLGWVLRRGERVLWSMAGPASDDPRPRPAPAPARRRDADRLCAHRAPAQPPAWPRPGVRPRPPVFPDHRWRPVARAAARPQRGCLSGRMPINRALGRPRSGVTAAVLWLPCHGCPDPYWPTSICPVGPREVACLCSESSASPESSGIGEVSGPLPGD